MSKFTGVIILLISAVFYSSLTPILKKANQQVPPFTVMAISMFILFALSFIGSIFFEGGFHIKQSILKDNLFPLILVGALNFLGFYLAILGFKYFPVWQLQMFTLLYPVFSGIFAYFLLGEKITVNLFLGLMVMALGLFIAIR